MPRLRTLLCGMALYPVLTLAQTPPASAQADPQAWLLGQIRLAESLGRDDLLDSALARLQQFDPQHPEVMAARLRQALRQDQPETAAQWLEQLEQSAPGSPLWQSARLQLQLASEAGRAQLMAIRQQAEEDPAQALAALEALFTGHWPGIELALEYWRLRDRLDGQRPAVLAGLQALVAEYPQQPTLRLRLADLLFAEGREREALDQLQALAEHPQARLAAAEREFQYLQEQSLSAAAGLRWGTFMHRYPDSPLKEEARQEQERVRQRLADPAWQALLRGEALLEQDNPEAALAALQPAVRRLPREAAVQGALGLALMRVGRHEEAQRAFAVARQSEQNLDRLSRWYSLQEVARYWGLIGQAEQQLAQQALEPARRLYAKARALQPQESAAWVGQANVLILQQDYPGAERLLRQARSLAPEDGDVLRGWLRLYQAQSPERALAFLEGLPERLRQPFADALRDLRVEVLLKEADALQARGETAAEVQVLSRARALKPDNPWLTYRLSDRLLALGRGAEAEPLFADLLQRQGQLPAARYAHALYLSAQTRDDEARASLQQIPRTAWSADMQALDERLAERQLLTRAGALLDRFEQQLAAGQRQQARQALDALPELPATAVALRRRSAEAWLALGEADKALPLIESLQSEEGEPQLWRDAARLKADKAPQQALDLYARGLQDAGVLPAASAERLRDDRALTRATRPEAEDDWLRSSLRAEAAALYQRQNPTLRLQQEYAWRTDEVTGGISDLQQDLRLLQLEWPLSGGRAFLRAEDIVLDAGRFAAEADGLHRELFGTCALPGLPGCPITREQARGTTLALGWSDARWSVDLGRSPQGFALGNWLGGVSRSGDWGTLGWTLTTSRRPLANSLLSYAGARDPRTGIRWGAVTATGMTLGLSYDQGGDHGFWANIGQHWLEGEQVADNRRTRLMAGYYYRLNEQVNQRLRLGLTAMHWRYERDLGGYTLGQGGYYSPQRYNSLSLSLSQAWRSANWSVQLDGALGASWSRSAASRDYPLRGLIDGLLLAPPAADFDLNPGESGRAWSYRFTTLLERRLSDHWLLGGSFNWQQSEDYAPSYLQLQLRYLFEPWQGALPLGAELLTPYSEFR
ncbi:cellulose synthase subunit BcsC-related outer membrane protein [Pseudomonas sp. NW5]|uniref:cellulose synthase subunit BcsC-related outer membrane protein n=1 Tax=Pseudomonas sp. NW5 TaxID=2934934 RepID=UPI00202130BF|nr:cellulose synthase subunit BcsC-related outer membrane protein [Pseudomonas sp. NW5]MCL7462384.1 cellulose synthase subunit BcsC-related outer membrane protein [Pseudomonas sp. NW5]